MTVNGEVATHPTSVVKLSPLKKSASFTISVDKVEVCINHNDLINFIFKTKPDGAATESSSNRERIVRNSS